MRGLFLSFICCCAAVPLMAGPSKTAVPYNQSDIDTYLARIKTTEYAGLTARATPDWFRTGYIYQVNPRAFTAEGTIRAATAKLALVKDAGATAVYLMPVNVLSDDVAHFNEVQRQFGNAKSFYATKDYFNVEPDFGTNEDRKAFVDEAHRLGLKVIFDIVFFHCGYDAKLIQINPNWVRRNPDGSIALGKWGRPALNFEEQGLREYFLALLAYLVAEVGVDGFRCDVAELTPLAFWEEAHRRLSVLKPDAVLICEGYGCPGEQEKGFDACYDWQGKSALRGALDGKRPVSDIRKEWEIKRAHCEKGARFLRFLENHDETDASQKKGPRGDSDERWGRALFEAGLFYCFTSDGVPFLFNGNEFADRSFQRMLVKTPIDWSARETPEGQARLAFVRHMASLRQTDPAFGTDAKLVWLDNSAAKEVLSYERISRDGTSRHLCVVNLSKKPQAVDVAGRGTFELPAAGCLLK